MKKIMNFLYKVGYTLQSFIVYMLLIINILHKLLSVTCVTFWNVGYNLRMERRLQQNRTYIIDIQSVNIVYCNLFKYVTQCYK
jgi:hypothetical protein